MLAVTDDRPGTERGLTTGQAARALGIGHQTLMDYVQREGDDGGAKGFLRPPAFYRTPGGHYRWNLDEVRRQL
ncbi:MAG: hypothetical protein QOF00_5980, partial [Pseudonocardiales bacterium]|nr:hypothetical protein [Pseudonocardiales bacterium]